MIQVTTNEADKIKSEKPFPKLMISKVGKIVLFEKEGKGVVIRTTEGSIYENGEHSKIWDMDRFADYNEPVTIQNV